MTVVAEIGLVVEEDEEVLLVRDVAEVVPEAVLLLVREDVELVEPAELLVLPELLLVRDEVEVVELLLRVVVPVEELAVPVLVLAASR